MLLPVPPDSTVAAYITCSFVTSVAYRVSFQVLYFNVPLYSMHTKLPCRKCPRPRRGAAGTGQCRPRQRHQRAAAASFRRRLRQPRPSPGGQRVRRRRCVRFLRRGRPSRWRPTRPHPARSSASLSWTAVPAGGARAHVCVGIEILQRGSSGSCRKHVKMRNAATWKMNRYLCSANIRVGERWESLDPSPIHMQICKIAKTGSVHEKFIAAIGSANSP